jgi:hypothetical protein
LAGFSDDARFCVSMRADCVVYAGFEFNRQIAIASARGACVRREITTATIRRAMGISLSLNGAVTNVSLCDGNEYMVWYGSGLLTSRDCQSFWPIKNDSQRFLQRPNDSLGRYYY